MPGAERCREKDRELASGDFDGGRMVVEWWFNDGNLLVMVIYYWFMDDLLINLTITISNITINSIEIAIIVTSGN